jgi:hypothetical protein
MWAQERKIVVLTAASLVVSIVLFGFLKSSGTVSNGVYSFGGAFAGFIATWLLMLRAWGPDTLADRASKAGTAIVFEEVIKSLDLREASPMKSPQHASLNDYYRAIKMENDRNFHLHYATTGDGIEFNGSPTHPRTAQWRDGTVDHPGPRGEKLKHQYDLDIPLADVATGQPVSVGARMTYINAFTQLDEEWLETHVDKPTARLVMIIQMPDAMTAVHAEVITKKEGRSKIPDPPEPRIMHDGAMIYWSVENPRVDVRYALGWSWAPRGSLIEEKRSAAVNEYP